MPIANTNCFAINQPQLFVLLLHSNPRALRRLRTMMSKSSLGSHVFFCRPDFDKILEQHALLMIRDHAYSSSLLAFCGSRHVSAAVERAKVANDLLLHMSGYKRHHIEFTSECNGSTKRSPGKKNESNGEDSDSQLNNRASKSVVNESNGNGNGLYSSKQSFSVEFP